MGLFFLSHYGSCKNQDNQESFKTHHREILSSFDFGLPNQQKTYRRGRCYPIQKDEKQDRWIRYTSHETYEKGPVRGISFKLQEEERERKDKYVPEVSAVDTTAISVSTSAKAMLDAIGFGDLPGLAVSSDPLPKTYGFRGNARRV